jgi:hypothetical protein
VVKNPSFTEISGVGLERSSRRKPTVSETSRSNATPLPNEPETPKRYSSLNSASPQNEERLFSPRKLRSTRKKSGLGDGIRETRSTEPEPFVATTTNKKGKSQTNGRRIGTVVEPVLKTPMANGRVKKEELEGTFTRSLRPRK